jgi:RHS repeat-associated protein
MDYYPFGLMWEKQDVTSTDNLKWHHGKELQENEFAQQGKSLDLEDFGARMYDPILGRWWSVDPLAEKFLNLSPFSGMGNNPIFFIDPDGRSIKPVGTAATRAMETLILSYGSMKQIRNVMKMRVSEISGIYYSTDKKLQTPKEFKKSLRKEDIKLNKEQRNELYSLYKAIQDPMQTQIEIIQAASGNDFTSGNGGGSEGTTIDGEDNSLNANAGLQQMRDDIENAGGATQGIVDEAIRPANGPGTGPYSPDRVGTDHSYYNADPNADRSNVGVKGTILIDGTRKTDRQKADVIKNAITNEY